MLNVSPGVYSTSLPTALVKEVNILPVEQIEEQLQTLKLLVKVVVQTSQKDYNQGFNLNVSAIVDQQEEKYLLRDPMLRRYVYEPDIPAAIVNNIKVDNLSKNGSLLYYNEQTSSPLYSLTIEVPINIQSSGPLPHLSLLCFTSEIVHTQDSQTPNNLTLQDLPFQLGRPILEGVVRNGTIVRNSTIYKLLETVPGYGSIGDVWAGPVHAHPNKGLMAEAYHVERAHPRVSATSVPNQTIKDYRTNKVNDLISARSKPSSTIQQYFTKTYYSRSKDGSVRVHTNFNFLRYVKEQGQLSYLFDNTASLLLSVDLLDIKVFRNQVDVSNYSNYLTPEMKHPTACYSTNSSRRLVGTLADGAVQVIRTDAATGQSLEVLPLIIRDNQIQDESEGYYHYEIEIELNDNTSLVLVEMIQELEDKLTISQSYDLKLNNHGKKGFDVEAATLGNQEELNSDNTWRASLRDYISILQFVFGPAVNGIPNTLVARNLLVFASPYSATPESLAYFNRTLGEFINLMYDIVFPKTVGNIHQNQSFRSKIATTSALRRKLKIVSDIQENYHNNLTKHNGFDYFGNSINVNTLGLGRLDYKTYQQRINAEVEKYNVPSPGSVGINTYGYLSPTQIRTNTITFEAGSTIDFDKSLDLLSANENVSTVSKNFKANPLIKSATNSSIDYLLGLSGVSFEPQLVKLKDVRATEPSKTISVLDSADFISSTSEFAQDNLDALTALSGSSTLRFKQDLKKQKDFTTNPLLKDIVETNATDFRQVQVVNSNLISGSLAFEQIDKTPESFKDLNILEKSVNFNSVVKVEYAYGTGDNWKILDPASFDTLKNSQVTVLCRLSAPNKILNVENKFELNPYDQLFVLGDAPLPILNVEQAGTKAFSNYWDQIQKGVNKLFSNNLNTKAAGGGVMSQYAMTSTSPAPKSSTASTTDSSPTVTQTPSSTTTGGY
jgi:hypothetical protein